MLITTLNKSEEAFVHSQCSLKLEKIGEFDISALRTGGITKLGNFDIVNEGVCTKISSEFELATNSNGYFDEPKFRIEVAYQDSVLRHILIDKYALENICLPASTKSLYASARTMQVRAYKLIHIFIGDKKFLINDVWYDKVDFESTAFQDSTVTPGLFNLMYVNELLKSLGA